MFKSPMNSHGNWGVKRIGNVLMLTIAGAFNEEGVLDVFAGMRAAMPMPKTGPWAVLVDSRHWDMASEHTLALVHDFRKQMFERGCSVYACVMANGLRKDIHQKLSVEFSQEKLRYFESLDDACDWLSACGFPISLGQ
jgi:hypothetical protein